MSVEAGMRLTDADKHRIVVIEAQVGALKEKNASDIAIIKALKDFIPEVKCMVSAAHAKELELYYTEYDNFATFVGLICH